MCDKSHHLSSYSAMVGSSNASEAEAEAEILTLDVREQLLRKTSKCLFMFLSQLLPAEDRRSRAVSQLIFFSIAPPALWRSKGLNLAAKQKRVTRWSQEKKDARETLELKVNLRIFSIEIGVRRY